MDITDLYSSLTEEMQLQEAFSSWKYKIPDDPEKLIYDFYFLSFFIKDGKTNDESFNFSITEASHEIIDFLTDHMLDALKFAINCEFHHVLSSSITTRGWEEDFRKFKDVKNFLKEYRKFVILDKNPFSSSRDKEINKNRIYKIEKTERRFFYFQVLLATQRSLHITDLEFSIIAQDVFDEASWIPGFGGIKWGEIASAYQHLLEAKSYSQKSIWIDHAYDLQHNNYTVFNKLKAYYKAPTDPEYLRWSHGFRREGERGYKWILKALEWKKNAASIISFYDKVSPSLKPLVAFASKHIDNKTLEDYLKEKKK